MKKNAIWEKKLGLMGDYYVDGLLVGREFKYVSIGFASTNDHFRVSTQYCFSAVSINYHVLYR